MLRSATRALIVAVGTGLATVLAYAAWLGWDTEKTLADGHLTGPYQSWQVIGLVVSIGLIAGTGGWLRHPVIAALVTTVALTVAWSYQAAQGEEPNFWPLGATVLAVGSAAGTAVVALLGRSVHDQSTPR